MRAARVDLEVVVGTDPDGQSGRSYVARAALEQVAAGTARDAVIAFAAVEVTADHSAADEVSSVGVRRDGTDLIEIVG